ncbi:MAG: phage tail protein [Eubacterium sp.]|jgi:hypothetical protein|nr:phage tail protein [Eubacterium sp.]
MADNSIITKYRRQKLCEITSGKITAMPKITHIAFGEGGVDASGNPIAPLDTETALKKELKRYALDAAPTYPVPTTARYSSTIPAADLAGSSISEAALVDNDGVVCAIKTFYVKRKDSGIMFTFTFDDEF